MNRRALLVILQLMSFMAFAPQDASAQGPGDSKRILRLFSEFKCKCPKEDWTRTLAGCFEPCVDPQKALIRKLVAQGLDDDAIRVDSIAEHLQGFDQVVRQLTTDAAALQLDEGFPAVSEQRAIDASTLGLSQTRPQLQHVFRVSHPEC